MATKQIDIQKSNTTQGSIFDQIGRFNDAIARRAYELFEGSGHACGWDLDHWLIAERELIFRPPIDFYEKDGRFEIKVGVLGIDPKDLDVEVTPESIMVKGKLHHDHGEKDSTVHACEFPCGELLRLIEFPKTIDPEKVSAKVVDGVLVCTAPIAEDHKARKINVQAA